MLWLGVRCWKDRIALAAVSDLPGGPELAFQRRERLPAGDMDLGEQAWWFFQLIEEVLDESGAGGLAIYVSSGGVDPARAGFEGTVAAAAGSRSIPVKPLRKQGMVKPLGLPDRKATTWDRFLKEDPLMSSMVRELREAAAASLAAARR